MEISASDGLSRSHLDIDTKLVHEKKLIATDALLRKRSTKTLLKSL
jgi:hypothetical protein